MNMAKRKKPKSESVDVRLPIPVLAFYEGLAAYAGVTTDEAIRVVLALAMLKRGTEPQEAPK
jgi:hypothetical protein